MKSLIRHSVSKFIFLVLCYLIAGRAAQFLAIPPAFAAPVWPAAGIALAGIYLGGYRYLPAVLAGAFITNLMISVDAGGAIVSVRGWAVAFGIAMGATLQAAVGVYLINRIDEPSLPGWSEKTFGMSLFLGGPISCLVNATWASFVLILAGILTFDDLLFNAFTWWVGDSIGVLILFPLILVLMGFVQEDIQSMLFSIILPSCLLVFTVIVFFFYARVAEKEAARQEFSKIVIHSADLVHNKFQNAQELLESVQRLYNASSFVERGEFESFLDNILETHKGVRLVAWLPHVQESERHSYEIKAAQDGFADFKLINEEGKVLSKGATNSLYFPVYYLVPSSQYQTLLGLDFWQVPDYQEILKDARDSGVQIASSVQQIRGVEGVVIVQPVYEQNKMLDNVVERRQFLKGFALVMVDVNGVVEATLDTTRREILDLHIYDNYLRDAAAYIYGSKNKAPYFSQQVVIELAGRQWTLEFTPTPMFLNIQRGWLAWLVLVGGLLFTALMQAFFIILAARTEWVRKLVVERTAELQEVNAELEEFAYRTSHDLRSPLVSSIALLGVAKQGLEKNETRQTVKSLELVQQSLIKLEKLVQDILLLTFAKAAIEEVVEVDIAQVVEEALSKLGHMDNFARLKINQSLNYTNTVRTQHHRFALIVENLLSNAIKYQDVQKRTSFIKISTYQKDNILVFEVEDNGLGIPLEHQKEIFSMFKRFHTGVSFGSGLGMYMIKKSAHALGGDIFYESKEDGSVFKLLIPLNDGGMS